MNNGSQKNTNLRRKLNCLWKDDRTFKQRLSFAFPVSAAFSLIFILFGIIDLYTSNMDSFEFILLDILDIIIIYTLSFTIILTFLLIIPRGLTFDFTISLSFGILIAGYLQGIFLNVSHGRLTGDAILWHNYFKRTILNTAIWCLIILFVILLRYLKPTLWANIIKFVSVVLAITQLVTLPFIMKKALTEKPYNESYLSTQDIYKVSPDDNIIVIVLDRLDSEYIQAISDEDPSFFNSLDGFTQFTNNISLYNNTLPSVANMFTGAKYSFKEPISVYFENAWQNSKLIPSLRSEGYNTTFYMSKMFCYSNIEDLEGIADNITEGKLSVDKLSIMANLLELSAYRYSPDVFKPFLWTTTDSFQGLTESTGDFPPYITDDYKFYKDLKQEQLSFNDTSKMFKYIHLHGSHGPYYIDENVNLTDNGNVIGATKGSFKIVYEYLNQLKELGLYEDATIIITGDHGAREDEQNPLSKQIVTGLFVKESGSFKTPLKYNNAPVSSENLIPTILSEANIQYPNNEKTYWEVSPDDTSIRVNYHKLWVSENNPHKLLEYHIVGDANDFSNWTLIKEEEVPD